LPDKTKKAEIEKISNVEMRSLLEVKIKKGTGPFFCGNCQSNGKGMARKI